MILSEYDATDEGEARSLLGMAITRNRSKRTLKLSQFSYVADIAKKFGFDSENRNRKSTIPMTSGNPDIGLFFFLITRRLVTLPHLLVHFCTWITALGQTLVLPWYLGQASEESLLCSPQGSQALTEILYQHQ